jgi:hypothetical protein
MITHTILRTALLDLLWELRNTGINLIIGGGYGIFLKTMHVREHNLRTLLAEKPEVRSTNDLDLFLRPELLILPGKLAPLSSAIEKFGYKVIETARNYQFIKPDVTGKEGIKIDFLTGPQSSFAGTKVRSDDRRVRPNPSIGLHAHPVEEAPALEVGLLPITLSGSMSNGTDGEGEISIPHPYSFLLMKLFAFRDRIADESKEFSRYHALDIYSIIATTTEEEWNAFPDFRRHFGNNIQVKEAVTIVEKYFSSLNQLGIIRMRESRYFQPELQIGDCISILRETFLQ